LGYVFQIVLLYWMAASHKSFQGWLIEGSAVWFAFHIVIFTWPSARQLLSFQALLQLFSRGAYLIQWAAPLLLIWPSRSITPRLVGLALLASMHLGFLPVLKLGLFPWVSLVCLLPLIPGQPWQRWLKPKPNGPTLPTIYYDQDCRFCRDAATIDTRLLCLEGCPLLPAQSDASVEAVMRQTNSWVVQTADGQRNVEFAAFLQLCAASPWAHRLTGPLAAITPLGTRIYRLVSHRRRSAWRLLNALRGQPIHVGIRLQQACAATVIGLMLLAAWHASLAQASNSFQQATASFGNRLRHLGLQQRWMVFSPMPMANDGWFELHLQPDDGPQHRLLVPSLTPVSSSTNPLRSQPLYRTQRQRKFFHNLQQPEHSRGAEAYARFACRQLAATPGFTPGELELVWMQETTQPPPLPPAPVQTVSRLRQRCG
jgi:predicted DCC family thiol-disulfide oxidoreductase YuxK